MKNPVDRKFSMLKYALILILIVNLSTSAWAYERRSNNANGVRVDVVPVQLNAGKAPRFQIRMTTHSVELSYDLVAISILKDDQGREYKASVWDGSPPGGHHRSGVLEFPAIPSDAKSVNLFIKNIAGVSERVFEWKLAA